jgi:hypothetical protein
MEIAGAVIEPRCHDGGIPALSRDQRCEFVMPRSPGKVGGIGVVVDDQHVVILRPSRSTGHPPGNPLHDHHGDRSCDQRTRQSHRG